MPPKVAFFVLTILVAIMLLFLFTICLCTPPMHTLFPTIPPPKDIKHHSFPFSTGIISYFWILNLCHCAWHTEAPWKISPEYLVNELKVNAFKKLAALGEYLIFL